MAKIKLDKTAIFVILLGVLILASLGFTLKESFESEVSKSDSGKAARKGSSYDPFGTGSGTGGNSNQVVETTIDENYDSDIYLPPTRNEREAYSGTAQSALPKGIPRSQIAAGEEDLYILKSEVVPPVCPKCPDVRNCPRPKPCPPCPSCARCPEPAFECKKIPTYSSTNSRLPRPFLNDFSQFT